MHTIGSYAVKWRRVAFVMATAIAFIAGAIGVAPSASAHHATPKPLSGAALAYQMNHYTIAQEKAWLYAYGFSAMAKALKGHGTPVKVDMSKVPGSHRYGTVTQYGSWGGYLADTYNVTNTNEVYSCYNASQASNTSYIFGSWVGIGGYRGDLLQTGIDIAKYFGYGWNEWVLSGGGGVGPNYFNLNIVKGDNICSFTTRTSPGVWVTDTEDMRDGLDTYYTWNDSPDHTTAEVVMEWGCYGCANVPSFTNVDFTGAYWDDINYQQWSFGDASTHETLRDLKMNTPGYTNCVIPATLYNYGEGGANPYSDFYDDFWSGGC